MHICTHAHHTVCRTSIHFKALLTHIYIDQTHKYTSNSGSLWQIKGSVHLITNKIFSHLFLAVSYHPDSFGFICLNFSFFSNFRLFCWIDTPKLKQFIIVYEEEKAGNHQDREAIIGYCSAFCLDLNDRLSKQLINTLKGTYHAHF